MRKIAMCKQVGSEVDVYDEKGNHMWRRSGTLVGFTSSSVTMKVGNYLATFDEKSWQILSKPL